MSISSLFKKQVQIVEKPAPELCPACNSELVKVRQDDGIYCQECGELLSFYVATPKSVNISSFSGLPMYDFGCPRCGYLENDAPSDSFIRTGTEIKVRCNHCYAILHPPSGFCVSCWEKLANNGRCINSRCANYHKPDAARFIPIYEIRVPSPHCGSCGQPFTVLNLEAGNRKIAEIALGPGGYEWIAKHKGCSQCGHPFEKQSKAKK